MAVSGVGNSTRTSSLFGNRNIISGLASGMDTESMIEKMVMGTKGRIDKQKQMQTKLLWQQQSYRSISDKLVALSTKYTSYASSSSNLMSTNFFKPSVITSVGKNKDMISASGSTTSDVVINGVTQLAKNEAVTFEGLGGVSAKDSITGKEIDLKGDIETSNIAGKSLTMKYGNKTFSITLDRGKEYKTAQDVVDEINKQLETVSVASDGGGDIKIGEKVKVELNKDNKIEFKFTNDKDNNTLEISNGSSSDLLNALHIKAGDKLTKDSSLQSSEEVKAADLISRRSVESQFAGAEMKLKFNGTSYTLKFPEKDSAEYKKIFESQDPNQALTNYIQDKLNNAFGYNRVTVDNVSTNGKFQLKFTASDNGVFSVEGGSSSLIGKSGALGIDYGESNRLNFKASLSDMYETEKKTENGKEITFIKGMTALKDASGNTKTDSDGNALYSFEINGVKIGEFSAKTDLDTITKAVNDNKDAHVQLTYSPSSNQFVLSSTHGGAGGRVAIGEKSTDGASTNLAAHLFGKITYGDKTNANVTIERRDNGGQFAVDNKTTTHVQGQDAKLTATVNGAKQEYTSGTNTFDIDGLKVTANGTFVEEPGSNVTFNAKVDSDKIVDAVKSFVEDYNKMLDELHDLISTQPDRSKRGGFEPLTDDQKADMSEKQIKEYEEKAKKGLMFADNDLEALSSSLRFVFSSPEMAKVGINVSTSYSEKGKISFDEKKLREALDADPEAVGKAFAAPITTTTDANGYQTTTGGAISKLKVQLDKFAGTTGATKGILIEKAGSQFAPLSLMNNTLQKQMDSYDKILDSLNDKLNREIDTYTAKFSKLEVLIGQMNSQSATLAGLTGGGGMGF